MTSSFVSTALRHGRELVSVVGAFRNWPTYLAHYFHLTRRRYMEINLRKYPLRVKSVGRHWEFHSLYLLMFVEDEYRLRQYRLPPGSTIVDIGAQIGWFTLAAAFIVPDVTVFCYEPLPENHELLEANLRLNGLSRCHAFQMAVSDEVGEATLTMAGRFGGESTGGTLLADRVGTPVAAPRTYRVRTTTLDEIVRSNRIATCDLLKIDCEGAEHQILRATSMDTFARIKRIAVEVDELGRDASMATLKKLLSEKGYTVESGGRWGNILYAVKV